MNIRMLPISFVFSRFPRLAHDIGSKLGKKIELKLIGENTEVDKTVVEILSDHWCTWSEIALITVSKCPMSGWRPVSPRPAPSF